MRADGGGVRRLTSDPARDENPAWSPDGKSILFVSERDSPGMGRLFVMGTDGSAQRALRTPPAGASVADWQPNVDLTLIAQRRPRARGRRTASVLFAIANTSPTETGRVLRLRVRVERSVRVTETSRRCAPSRTINCALGALSPGGVARVRMSLRPRRCGTFSVSASVTSLKPDPRPGNNRARVRLRARC